MYRVWRSWYWQLGIANFLAVSGAIAAAENPGLTQPAPDGTLGAENSVVTDNVNLNGVPSDRIDGGARRGANLFHSFREFNIDEGRAVYFTNPAGVENILSRVTGGNRSEILGKLGVLGNANLFLINPSGMLFGANASLDISGSFVATTASSLKFADRTEFSATNPQIAPLLTVSVPLGLQFGENIGNIQVQGNGRGIRLDSRLTDPSTDVGLRVRPDRTLALVGGNLALEGGTLKTAGGRIELGSIAGSGSVGLNDTNKGFGLNYEGVSAFGDIQFSGVAVVDASGLGGGDIQVVGRRITLRDASQIEASTLGSEPGGTLTVRASDSIELRGSARASNGELFSGGLFTKAYAGTTGTAGNIEISTGKLTILDGAAASSGTFRDSQGRGGNLSIAADTVELKGTSADGQSVSGLFTRTQGTGNAGDLRLNTKNLTVRDGAAISASTFGSGTGGELNISANTVELQGTFADEQSVSGIFTQTQGTGDAGDLKLNTKNLTVRDGAAISASTFGSGTGGELNISADTVELNGTSPGGLFASGLYAQAEDAGNAGNLTMTTKDLFVHDGALVSASTFGSGRGGELRIDASNSINLLGVDSSGYSSGLFTSARGIGDAGNTILNTDRLQLADGAVISASTRSAGRGGNIQVRANRLEAFQGGQILTTTRSSGRAGNINLTVAEGMTFSGSDPTFTKRQTQLGDRINNEGAASGLFATATSRSTGQGGTLQITTSDLTIRDAARISASSAGTGNAGDIELTARSVRLDNQGEIAAETSSGRGGNINLQAQDLLALRREAQISTNAGMTGMNGDGGNIKIDTDLFSLVGSNITANAFLGKGGNVRIITQGLFRSPDSTISASSQQGIDGVVEINRPDVDPHTELIILPAEIVNVSGLIAQGCAVNGNRTASESSRFLVTGRGGLPYTPQDAFNMDAVVEDWGNFHLAAAEKQRSRPRERQKADSTQAAMPSNPAAPSTIEAQGWQIGDRGEVVLTAGTNLPYSPVPHAATCHAD